MAGAAGFEPAVHGIKTRCLTAWLRPNQNLKVIKIELCLHDCLLSTLVEHPFVDYYGYFSIKIIHF